LGKKLRIRENAVAKLKRVIETRDAWNGGCEQVEFITA